MADTPQFLTLKDHRDDPHGWERWARWILVTLISALALAALLGLIGQTPTRSVATGGGATLEVSAPTELRGGLFFQGRFTVRANEEIEDATIVLDRGWLEDMHINTIEPAPVGEASREGRLALNMGHVAAGDFIVLYMQFQVNPTNVGRRSQTVSLYDDTTLLAVAERTVTILP